MTRMGRFEKRTDEEVGGRRVGLIVNRSIILANERLTFIGYRSVSLGIGEIGASCTRKCLLT